MKKIFKSLLVGLLFVNAGCADIDLAPLSEGSSESWYRDVTEIEMSLNDLLRLDFYTLDSWQWDDDLERRDDPAAHDSGLSVCKVCAEAESVQ